MPLGLRRKKDDVHRLRTQRLCYTAVLAKGDSQEKAFGYAYAVIAAAALKAGLINAGEVGMGKAPFFVWGAIASYIAYKALDE